MNKEFEYQQGDVLFFKVDSLKENLKPVQPRNRGYVLADGEATGHAHTICDCGNVEMYEDENGTLFLKVTEKKESVTHEEHNTVTIEPGIYEIGIVNEYDPDEEEIRKVRD